MEEYSIMAPSVAMQQFVVLVPVSCVTHVVYSETCYNNAIHDSV